MQKATLKKGILLLVMAASLCLNFTTTHSASRGSTSQRQKGCRGDLSWGFLLRRQRRGRLL